MASLRPSGVELPARIARYLTLALVTAILLLTLLPARSHEGLYPSGICLVCGARGLADALLNLGLFFPLGLALAVGGGSRRQALLGGVLLSCCIELAQLAIPGRDPSPADVLYNMLGLGLGLHAVRLLVRCLFPDRTLANRLLISWTLVVAATVSVTGYLLQPSLPRNEYYGQWTPALGHLERYRGRVTDASIGPLRLTAGLLPRPDSVRSLLRGGAALQVRAVAGPRTSALASLVSVYDRESREIFLLGPDGGDLVYRYRTRATAWHLDQPDIRWVGGMRDVRPGERLEVAASRGRHGFCLSINAAGTCGLGFSAASGWTLLLYAEAFPAWLKGVLNVLWLGALTLPIGYWVRATRAVAALGLVLATFVVVPALTPLAPVGAVELLTVAVAVATGIALSRFAAAVAHRERGAGRVKMG